MTLQNGEERLARSEARFAQIEGAIRAVDHILGAAAKAERMGDRARKSLRLTNLLMIAGAAVAITLVVLGRNSVQQQSGGSPNRIGDTSQKIAA